MTPTHFTFSMTFALGLLGLAFYRKHLVSALLCIEVMMLALFMTLALTHQTTNLVSTAMQPIILLTLSACEAGTGLALLVATARTHASDNLNSLNLLKC